MSESYQVVVIGSGPGGYVAALKAAQMGARTAVVEMAPNLGGTCLNNGCIPSKALLASSELLHHIAGAKEFGVAVSGEVTFDWKTIQTRKDRVIRRLRGGIKSLFAGRDVTVVPGRGALDGAGRVKVQGADGATTILTGDNVILAVGSEPARIPGWPTDPDRVCTSDEALHWATLPQSVLIVGGGVIGCEFACMLQAFGVQVTVVELMERLLPEMDEDLGPALEAILKKRGIAIHTGVKVDDLTADETGCAARLSNGATVAAEKTLVAVGRRPLTTNLGLESVGLSTDRGFLRVNDQMETNAKGVYCIGDANGRCLLAHAASAHGVTAVQNALGHKESLTAPVPGAVYTYPEIGSVGLTAQAARAQGIPIAIGNFPIGHLGKAMAVGDGEGFAKVIRHRETGALLGAHLIGHNATECIAAAGAMIHQGATTEDLAELIIAHPSISESLKEAAEDALGVALHLPPRQVTQLAL